MQKYVLFALLLLALTVPAGATVINFDDLETPNVSAGAANWGLVPTTYAGFTWSGWEVVDGVTFQSVYAPLAFPSMPNAAYNGGNGNSTITMSAANPFNLAGAYFSFWPHVGSAAAGSVTVTGKLGSTTVGSTVVNLGSQAGFNWASLNLNGVDSVTFSTTANKYWLVDDLSVASVPEPASMALLGTGLVALGWAGRKRLKHTA